MKIMVVNSGSSSIKYQIFEMPDAVVLASGIIEKIGEPGSRLKHSRLNSSGGHDSIERTHDVPGHREGFELIISVNTESGIIQDPDELAGIGHRVVHGGEAFHSPAIITKKVINTIKEMVPLAPLHNPANLTGIEVLLEQYPGVPQVAVFDTAFHQSMPPHAFHYALPRKLYSDYHVRRYGFHGTSHHYVAKEAASHFGKPLSELNLITIHLGNGSSIAAIKSGKCIDTSMGMTPLEGLIMGTRCGDLDPAIHFYLAGTTGKSLNDLESLLNKESGLKGICGVNDMREVLELAKQGNTDAKLAIDMYCYRIKKYIGSYIAALGRTDAIIFTGGIGENARPVRRLSCKGMANLGIVFDERKNEESSGRLFEVQERDSTVKVLVISTDEELEIARQTVREISPEKAAGYL